MKPSGDGLPPESAESCLRNLRIDLCNLIVESRTPGISANGYGEGVHCPPVSGTSSHRCNPASVECQRYQKLLQHLQLAHGSVGFEVDVLLLPECCLTDSDFKLSERVSNQEYLLLEKWNMNICSANFAKPVVDVNGFLRAIRSFLHFSQLSAWLSLHKGKSPANIHYRLSARGETLNAKFKGKPETHVFPSIRISENIFSSVKVSYCQRTRLLPPIPCAKHSKKKEDTPGSSKGCPNHILPLKISNKNDLLIRGANIMQVPLGSSTNLSHTSKWNRSTARTNLCRNVVGQSSNEGQLVPKEPYDPIADELRENNIHSALPLLNSSNLIDSKNAQNVNMVVENVCLHHTSSEIVFKRKKNKRQHGKVKCKIKKLTLSKIALTSELKSSNEQDVIESPKIGTKFHIYDESEQPPPCVVANESNKSKNVLLEQGETSHNQDVKMIEISKISQLPKKRKFSLFCNVIDQSVCSNVPTISPVTYQEGQSNLQCKFSSPKHGILLRDANCHVLETVKNVQEQCGRTCEKPKSSDCSSMKLNPSESRVLRDVKNTSVVSEKKKASVIEEMQRHVVASSRIAVPHLSSSNTKCDSLPLPSSPVPIRKTFLPFTHGNAIVPLEKRRALFQDAFKLGNNNTQPQRQKLYKGIPLLGNFEESILNDRFQPINTVHGFTAEIGASGSFCPDHMTLPAKVFFYELNSVERGTSPYMGHINLNKIEYHVPKKGAVQVTLFNPHGTVVKVFLVNYDMSQMPPMCHTFVRQRTFYMPISATEKEPSRKFLRYIIHLRFASSKSGKIFLHKDLKLVVINKSDVDAASIHSQWQYELRSFIQIPTNPRFSTLS